MKTVDLTQEQIDLTGLLELAQNEPILLLTADGQEFLLAEADDFEREVEALRTSQTFQQFLEERSVGEKRISLDELEFEIDRELAILNPDKRPD
jgi:hypothetical protein